MKNKFRRPWEILLTAATVLLASCGTQNASTLPRQGSLLPNAVIQVTPSVAYTTEQIAAAGVAVGLIYLVYDPMAPNWSVEERVVGESLYVLSMKAKSYRIGGDGEAMKVLKRRALHLQQEKGYTGYQIIEYSEGIESGTPFTHRVAEGTFRLVKAQ